MVETFSYLIYLFLIRSTSQEKTLSGKEAFEIWDETFGFKVNRYHVYNGIFSEQPFRSAVEDSNHTITFCAVGYHHQNSIVERKIKALTLGARTLLLNAKIYFPEAINTMLWPYSLKPCVEQLNELKVDDDGITPIEKFAGTTTDITLKNHHTWGFPVYLLD